MSEAFSMQERVAVVTGGAGGIGAAVARLLAARGAAVAVADLDFERAQEVAGEIGGEAVAVHLDLEDEASIASMIETVAGRFGRLDVLDNNAAFLSPEVAQRDLDVETMDTALWDRTFRINVRGAMIACRQALPWLARSGSGAIVNTVSNLALQGHVIQAAYSASKAALIQLTRSIAASHGPRGVRCNAVAPGLTLTQAAADAFPQVVRDLVAAETLRDRLGSPEDIAQVVAFLASDAACNLTGQVLVADGGLASHVPGIAGFRALMAH